MRKFLLLWMMGAALGIVVATVPAPPTDPTLFDQNGVFQAPRAR